MFDNEIESWLAQQRTETLFIVIEEMMIVFVYDTLACTAEEDDPADAVLYFHPGWVSDTQRHALAGQVTPPVKATARASRSRVPWRHSHYFGNFRSRAAHEFILELHTVCTEHLPSHAPGDFHPVSYYM
ncbi:unnamed protein product [Plutella xylostella]|uniref:(diamondback moth) hypothetical protein n=1 Tax=Plutella xylostella TaxID=51655 RepID=A0A8S4DPZ2_PLUXY|nr:unnamed protein product [Plutella xylostella]